jgi:L-methionine (R)-S-oxide reductase
MHDPFRATPWTAVRKGGGFMTVYQSLLQELEALLSGEPDPIANAANTAAAIYHSLSDLNWAGFYFLRGQELVLGPFQGRPACVRIPLGRGVCGTAAAERRSLLVPDVHAFPGHIACDAESRSELVVPLFAPDGSTHGGLVAGGSAGAGILGVLDLDSPIRGRFSAADQAGCEAIAELLVRHLPPR